jgi:exonuclease SbcC
MEALKETLASLEEHVEEYEKVRTAILDHETNNIEPSYISAKTQADKLPELKNHIEVYKKQVDELELKLRNETYAIEKKEEIQNHNKTLIQLKEDVESYHLTKATIETYEQEEVEALYTKAETESKRIPEIETSITNKKKKMEELRTEIEDLEKNLRELEEIIKSMEKIPAELELLESENGLLRTNRATQDQIIKGSLDVVQGINGRLVSLNKDLERYQDNIEQADVLRITESWISQVLLPSIQSIEKNVLYTINQEFNKLFKRWFSSLIESDELQGFIDQDFTPIVEQGGYELEVESLSGGEKTSVALAYRLALNTIVKQVTNTMKSNLLILDEPTDGFSKEQLNKLHDILNELGCNQVILVSHEKELETVADSIYRVNKLGNTSTVTHP